MATTTGLTYEQARAKQEELKASGKTASNSKEYGKLENYIKTLKPENYGAETVASAKQALSTSTQQPNVAGGNSGGSGANLSGDLNTLYDQLNGSSDIQAKKDELATLQKKRDEAVGGTQSNPWYSQATRGGKIAAINSDAERNISRVSGELTKLQTEAQNRYNVAVQQMQLNKPTVQMYQDAYGNQWKLTLDSNGNVVSQQNLGGGKSAAESDPFRYLEMLTKLNNNGDTAGVQDNAVPGNPPQMSAAVGTEIEYPAGSGWFWTMGTEGWN